jgi:hypothetical protein
MDLTPRRKYNLIRLGTDRIIKANNEGRINNYAQLLYEVSKNITIKNLEDEDERLAIASYIGYLSRLPIEITKYDDNVKTYLLDRQWLNDDININHHDNVNIHNILLDLNNAIQELNAAKDKVNIIKSKVMELLNNI